MLLKSYSTRRYTSIILLVCYMVVATLTVGSVIDAKPKKGNDIDDIADAGFWDDVKKLLKPDKLIEDILKRIGVIEKTVQELKNERDIHKIHAVSCDNSVTQWETQKKIFEDSYTAAYNDHSAATQALSRAKAALTVAQEDINTANDELDRLSYLSNKYSGSAVSDKIDEWQAKLRDARRRKSAAESDIPMQEAIIAAAEQHMTDTQKLIVMAESMITHFENREKYHDGQVTILQEKIDNLNAEKKAEEQKKKNILDDYDKKDQDD